MSDDAKSKQERFVVVNESGERLTKPLPKEEIPAHLSKLQETTGGENLRTRQVLEE